MSTINSCPKTRRTAFTTELGKVTGLDIFINPITNFWTFLQRNLLQSFINNMLNIKSISKQKQIAYFMKFIQSSKIKEWSGEQAIL